MAHASVLLILADPFDAEARAFAAVHAATGVLRLTPRDLSREGWRLHLEDPKSVIAVCGEQRIGSGEIGGVLTRLSHVAEEHIPHIAAEDCAYVACEMTAFFLAFLKGLACRVSNRPTLQCLCGPMWSPERWRRLARDLGFAVQSWPTLAALSEEAPRPKSPQTVVTVVGGTVFGDTRLGPLVQALAHAPGVDMLQMEFDGDGSNATLLRARPLVKLGEAEIAAAALTLFETRARHIA